MYRYFLIFVLSASFALAGTIDNFDRPDSTTGLGSNWTNLGEGSAQIVNGRALAGGGIGSHVLVQYNGPTENNLWADVTSESGLGYVALVLNVSDAPFGSALNYFIKIQQQSGSSGFDTYVFYYGNNGSSPSNSGQFSTLAAPFTSGRIAASVSGLTATLTITPTGGGSVQTYSHTYTNGTLGSGIGLGLFGAATADNFGTGLSDPIGDPVPEPASFGLLFAGAGALVLYRRRRTCHSVT